MWFMCRYTCVLVYRCSIEELQTRLGAQTGDISGLKKENDGIRKENADMKVAIAESKKAIIENKDQSEVYSVLINQGRKHSR